MKFVVDNMNVACYYTKADASDGNKKAGTSLGDKDFVQLVNVGNVKDKNKKVVDKCEKL